MPTSAYYATSDIVEFNTIENVYHSSTIDRLNYTFKKNRLYRIIITNTNINEIKSSLQIFLYSDNDGYNYKQNILKNFLYGNQLIVIFKANNDCSSIGIYVCTTINSTVCYYVEAYSYLGTNNISLEGNVQLYFYSDSNLYFKTYGTSLLFRWDGHGLIYRAIYAQNEYSTITNFLAAYLPNYNEYLYTDDEGLEWFLLPTTYYLVLDPIKLVASVVQRYDVPAHILLLGYIDTSNYISGKFYNAYQDMLINSIGSAQKLLPKYTNHLTYISRGNGIRAKKINNGVLRIEFLDSIYILNNNSPYDDITYEHIVNDLRDTDYTYGELSIAETGSGNTGFYINLLTDRSTIYYNFDTKKIIIRINYGVFNNEIPLLKTTFNNIAGGELINYYLKTLTEDGDNRILNTINTVDWYTATDYNIDSKISDYNSLTLSHNGCTESYLYFTDPHCITTHNVNNSTHKLISTIEYAYNRTATNYVVCGGDWLNNNDTQVEAMNILSNINGLMRSKFRDKYIPIIGNHDTNYQGKEISSSAANTGRLPQQTLQRLWFGEYGDKTYYSKLGQNTRFYIFDTEIDWTGNNDSDFKKEQVNWFASKLLEYDDRHSVVLMHIISNQWNDNGTGDITYEINNNGVIPLVMQKNICNVITAYNNKSTITINNIEYDYSKTTGKVAFIHVGHMHFDWAGTYNGIPIIITTNTSFAPRFDLCLIDYDNAIYYLTRIGSGEDREISIIV